MFRHKNPSKTKSTLLYFAFRIFYAHILSIILMVILAVALSLLQETAGFTDNTIALIVNIACFLLYMYFVYNESRGIGQHDYNQVFYEHKKRDPLKPIKAALISQAPGIALAIWVQFSPNSPNALTYANWFYANFRYPIKVSVDSGIYWVYLIPWVFAVAFAFIGFSLGYKQKRLADFFVYKS